MSTDTQTINRIKELRRAAEALATFHDAYSEKYARDSHCDKKGYGFGRDRRFSAFRIETSFDSWRGYFGNSSCSSILHVDGALVGKYAEAALNMHQRELFATMARLMREEAAGLAEAAEKELAAMQALLNSAKEDAA